MASTRRKVWFHRSRAICWAIVGVASFPLGWADSVVLVWIASLYANIATDIGSAEAADDREVLDQLAAIRDELGETRRELAAIRERLPPAPWCPNGQSPDRGASRGFAKRYSPR